MTPAGTVNAVIPRHVIAEMSRLLADDGKGDAILRMAKGRIAAEIGHTTVTATLIGEQFISYRQILPQRFDTRATVKTAELEQAIDRASLIAREGKNSLITLTTEGGMLRVSAVSDIGDTHEEIAATVQGKPLEIAFNSRYIGEAMKNIRDECCALQVEDGARPCVIKSADGEGDYLFLVLPVRNTEK
jgi:DNA polymerase III subunit beta